MESLLIYSLLPWFSCASFYRPLVQKQVYQRLQKFFIPMCVNTPYATLSRVRINVRHDSQPNKHGDVFSSFAYPINALILSSEGNSFAERVEAPQKNEIESWYSFCFEKTERVVSSGLIPISAHIEVDINWSIWLRQSFVRVIPNVSLSFPARFLPLRSLTEPHLSNACGVHVAAIINTVTSSHVQRST